MVVNLALVFICQAPSITTKRRGQTNARAASLNQRLTNHSEEVNEDAMKWNGNPKEQREAMILTSIGEKLKRNAFEFFSGETCQSVEMN